MGNVVARIGAGCRKQGVTMWVLPTFITGVVVCDVYQYRYHAKVLAPTSGDDDFHNVGGWSLTKHLAGVTGLGLQVVGMETWKSPRDRAKEKEFAKNPDLKREDIDTLRAWVAKEKHLPSVTDEMLIIFHHSCYYVLEDTKQCIENYYTMRTQSPEFFSERDVSNPKLAKSLEALNLTPLPCPIPTTGYRIMYHGLQNYDPSKYDFFAAVKLTFMMFDAYLYENGTSPGFTVIFDMQGTKIGHLFRLNMKALRKYVIYMQEASPIRLKAIHMINSNYLVDKTLLLVKPFMKQELVNLIYIHKPGSDTLYEHIPKQCLPKECGGSLDSKQVYYARHLKKLKKLVNYFKIEEKHRVNEALRDKKKKR